MLHRRIKMLLAVAAALAALAILFKHLTVDQGTDVLIATLAAGAGYLFKDVDEETRKLRNICQAYAAVISVQFEGIWHTLADSELDRFLQLAPAIADASQAESIGSRADNPFSELPDLKDNLHVMGQDTVRFISSWRTKTTDLLAIYDQLGTRQQAILGTERLERYFEAVRKVRDEYRDIGYTTLLCLQRDSPAIRIDLRIHEDAEARDLRTELLGSHPVPPWAGQPRSGQTVRASGRT